jgi:thiol-disulfide isomerase/thioredoxin
LVIIIALFAFYGVRDDTSGSDLSVFGSAENTPYTDMNGNPIDVTTRYEGDILIVNSWASWCPYCVEELPHLGQLAVEYADRGVAILAINRAEPRGTAQAYVEYVGNPADIVFLLDERDVFYDTIKGYAMPETVVYDRSGNMIAHKRGAMSYEQMQALVEEALSNEEEQS